MKYKTDCKMYSLVNMGNPGGVPYCSIKGLEPDCKNCQRPSKTNADYIRAMTDKELARYLDNMQSLSYQNGVDVEPIRVYPNNYGAWLDWLRQGVDTDV